MRLEEAQGRTGGSERGKQACGQPVCVNNININNNIYLLQLGCYPRAVVILNVNKTLNWLLLNLSREGCMRKM